MTGELTLWQEQNDAYLNAALAWLRLCLMKNLASAQPSISSPVPPPEQAPNVIQKSRWSFFQNPESASHPTLVLPAPEQTPEDQLAHAAAAMREAAQMEPSPALVMLSRQFGLSEYEQNIVLLCAAVEFDTGIAALCEVAQGGRAARPYPTFALAMTIFDQPSWDAIAPHRPLRYWHLLEIHQPGAQPLTTSALRVDERIVNYIKGLNVLDDRLALVLDPLSIKEETLPPSQRTVAQKILEHIRQRAGDGGSLVIQLSGTDISSKPIIAQDVAERFGFRLYRLDAEYLPANAAELENFARLWKRETLLLPIRLYVRIPEGDTVSAEISATRWASLKRLMTRYPDLMFVETADRQCELDELAVPFEVEKPTAQEQRALWIEELGSGSEDLANVLAGQFYLDFSSIRRMAQTSRKDAGSEGEETTAIWVRCSQQARPRFDSLAQRVDVKATWDDLILPAEAMRQLRQMADQVRHRMKVYDEWGYRARMNRGFGISALFAGESGTGKTLAAEVVARHLQLPLYQVDLSTVTSKFIGETEKNLRRIFDASEESGCILCFNEADTLFNKRVEQTSHLDQFANNIINYLLQRMEAYRGLAILTTNIKSAVDQAFLRRLRFIITFPFPGIPERKRLWEQVFPPEVPIDPLDYDRLARFSLTGGHVHNAALNAAFLAAQAGTKVQMPLVLAAIRNEFKKLERPMNEAEFRWVEPAEARA